MKDNHNDTILKTLLSKAPFDNRAALNIWSERNIGKKVDLHRCNIAIALKKLRDAGKIKREKRHKVKGRSGVYAYEVVE